jgi:hypothetical protein
MSHFYAIEHATESGYYFSGFDELTGEPTWYSPKEQSCSAKILISGYLSADDFDKIVEKVGGVIVEFTWRFI